MRSVGLAFMGSFLSVSVAVGQPFSTPQKDTETAPVRGMIRRDGGEAAGSGAYGRRWALIIGINYADSKAKLTLKNPENDAQDLRKLLETSYGFECTELLGPAATKENIVQKLKHLTGQVKPADCFLFYFAGHGITQRDAPSVYPVDVESFDGTLKESGPLDASTILGYRMDVLHSLYVFDSCYSGNVLNCLKYVPGYDSAVLLQGTPEFSQRSLQILASSASSQVANDGKGRNSPFAAALLEALSAPQGSAKSAQITAKSVFRFIHQKATAGEKGRADEQVPQLASFNPVRGSSSSQGGEFHFFVKGVLPAPQEGRLYFQTLPGSQASFPGAPYGRTWFDEMPWLTPAMRLALDGDSRDDVRSLAQTRQARPGSDAAAYRKTLQELVASGIGMGRWEVESGAREAIRELARIGSEAPGGGKTIAGLLDYSRTRAGTPTAADLHLQAMVRVLQENSALPGASRGESGGQTTDELFGRACQAYDAVYRGLRARCLADYAGWLLQNKNYPSGKARFEQALQEIDNAENLELFRVELHAGLAYAARNLAKNAVRDGLRRPDIVSLWNEAKRQYDEAMTIAARQDIPQGPPLRSYLHERLAWLSMDRWDVDEAIRHFREAREIHPAEGDADTLQFLSAASCRLGEAMANRLKVGSSRDQLTPIRNELAQIKDEIQARINAIGVSNQRPVAELCFLYQRLCNTSERLADCDFLLGRTGMDEAFSACDEGLDNARLYAELAVSRQQQYEVDEQTLRFSAKRVIAAVLARREEFSKVKGEYHSTVSAVATTMPQPTRLLCELADAFVAYSDARARTEGDIKQTQKSLDAIRVIIQDNSRVNIDREPAELLMMVSTVLSEEQRKLDADVAWGMIPKREDGKVPQGSNRFVREQCDRVILLEGSSYATGGISRVEFGEFLDRVLEARGMSWTPAEKRGPCAVFHFPLNGRQGLLLLNSGEGSRPEVVRLDFGWRGHGSLTPDERRRVEASLRFVKRPKLAWQDSLVGQESEGKYPADCPFRLEIGLR